MFTIPLTSLEAVESGSDDYFTQSNTHIPMAALKGVTPEEVVTGKWTDQVIAGMQSLVESARTARIEIQPQHEMYSMSRIAGSK
jgi:hypothetical protein